jgi:long-chain fatty acid transport protein
MRKVILASALLSAVGISFATNGDNLIGVSPASRGMGGIGVGMPVGPTDTIFRNPAWMTYYKGFNVSFGGILFFPEVKARAKHTSLSIDGSDTSKSKMFVVPEVGIVHQINDKLTFGIGAFGVSGMGVDYRDNRDLLRMHTTFQFMRIIPAIAYKVNDAISISGALHLAYGSLDMGATIPGTPPKHAGGGQSQTYGIGAQLGIAYNMGDFVYAGLTYQSPVSMTYKRVFDSDCFAGSCDGQFEDLKLTQPQELAFGVGVKPMNNLKVGMDIRWINWKNAKGYKEFQWNDQWVIALGGEFKPTQKLALRAGYNYGKSPIRGGTKDTTPNKTIPNFAVPFSDFQIAMFNLIGFPAITEHHITLGLGYEFTKNFGIDLAYKHAFNKKVRAEDGSGNFVEAQNAQNAISIGLNWKF